MAEYIRIGVPQSGYNVDRNICGSIPTGFRRVRPIDWARLKTAARSRLTTKTRAAEQFRFARPYWPQVDLFHVFNTVADVRVPWVCTFEDHVPRWGAVAEPIYRHGLKLLTDGFCSRLLAFSGAALNAARLRWEQRLASEELSSLLAKTEVLLPPQQILGSPKRPPRDVVPTFSFVGRDFYRKGGLELLEAMALLWNRGNRRWKAVVVGSLDTWGDYASRTNSTDRDRAIALLRMLSGNVVFKASATRKEIDTLFQSSDYYLLPTLADTFGYTVLEAQACGAVAITTNVRSLPEIVDSATGHVIALPLDEFRDAHRIEDISQLRHNLVAELSQLIARCCDTPSSERDAMAEAAMDRLRTSHAPEGHQARLAEIYHQAIDR